MKKNHIFEEVTVGCHVCGMTGISGPINPGDTLAKICTQCGGLGKYNMSYCVFDHRPKLIWNPPITHVLLSDGNKIPYRKFLKKAVPNFLFEQRLFEPKKEVRRRHHHPFQTGQKVKVIKKKDAKFCGFYRHLTNYRGQNFTVIEAKEVLCTCGARHWWADHENDCQLLRTADKYKIRLQAENGKILTNIWIPDNWNLSKPQLDEIQNDSWFDCYWFTKMRNQEPSA